MARGLGFNRPMPPPGKGTAAFGLVYSKVSDHFNRGYLLHSLPTFGAEKAFELNYMVRAQPWLIIQPAVEYYANLGGDTHRGDAVVAGFRIKVSFWEAIWRNKDS